MFSWNDPGMSSQSWCRSCTLGDLSLHIILLHHLPGWLQTSSAWLTLTYPQSMLLGEYGYQEQTAPSLRKSPGRRTHCFSPYSPGLNLIKKTHLGRLEAEKFSLLFGDYEPSYNGRISWLKWNMVTLPWGH